MPILPVMAARTTGSVFIVEDSPSIRSRLVEMIGEIDGVRVVGEAESPDAAVAGIRASRPDCVILDIQLTGGSGIDVLRAVHPGSPDIGFVVLTSNSAEQYRRACMQAGAGWFLDKSTEFSRLRNVVIECLGRGA
jgi:DNA-binding NarL/FixJ family response regulator